MTQRAQIRCSVETSRGGMEWEVGGRLKREGTQVYIWLIHVDIWKRPTQCGKLIILQLKIDIFLKEKGKVYLRLVTENKLFANCCL